MVRKTFTAEQIINKLREADKKIGVTEQTYYRWRKEYGGMCVEQARRLKEPEKKNYRRKKRWENSIGRKRMSSVEEWLSKGHKLSEDDKRVLDDLRTRARFATYCQRGGGTCMADFGALVARHAYRFGIETRELFQALLAEASEAASRGDWDV